MYLFIFEDGTIKKSSSYSDEDFESVENGYLDIVDISDPENPKVINGTEWEAVESV